MVKMHWRLTALPRLSSWTKEEGMERKGREETKEKEEGERRGGKEIGEK